MTFSGAKFISAFDLYDLLLNGDTFEDTRLQSGDARYIPKVKKAVSVDDAARDSAIDELKGSRTAEQLVV